MVEEKKVCPKCNCEMEQGELRDDQDLVSHAQKWATNAGSFIIHLSKGIVITSYRCTKCGFLENYAIEKNIGNEVQYIPLPKILKE